MSSFHMKYNYVKKQYIDHFFHFVKKEYQVENANILTKC